MEETTLNLLGNFGLNTFYKLFIYIGSVVLILSFFFDVKNYDTSLLRYQAIVVILAGLACWMWDTFRKVYTAAAEKSEDYTGKPVKAAKLLSFSKNYWFLVALTLTIAGVALFVRLF